MNANELADALDAIGDKYLVILGDIHFKEAAAFVRQQQAEIEALKAVLEQEGIGVGRDLLNGGIALFRKAQNEQ